MTIEQAIREVDDLKPNSYSETHKIKWLSRVDAMVHRLILDHHKTSIPVNFHGYNDATPMDTVLLVSDPFDEIYGAYLRAQIDYHNREFDSYNNEIETFHAAFSAFGDDYRSRHASADPAHFKW